MYHVKGFARGPVLKERHKVTRSWSILHYVSYVTSFTLISVTCTAF